MTDPGHIPVPSLGQQGSNPFFEIRYSLIVPTYNRRLLVHAAVESALCWIGSRSDTEIIVVDDGSSDGTLDHLRHAFSEELHLGRLRLLSLAHNSGVARARNRGIAEARGIWLVFLDSDDLLEPTSAVPFRQYCDLYSDAGILFFRCRSTKSKNLLGLATKTAIHLDLRSYLCRWRYGECLPVVSRTAMTKIQYDESFNGWEGLTYARILAQGLGAVVVPQIARQYRTEGDDRLSSAAGTRSRIKSLARGHRVMLREFGRYLTIEKLILQAIKATAYTAWDIWLRLKSIRYSI